MDAKALFDLVKPHLEKMKMGERKSFAQLVQNRRSKRRKILSLSRAKEKLRLFCHREMAKERS